MGKFTKGTPAKSANSSTPVKSGKHKQQGKDLVHAPKQQTVTPTSSSNKKGLSSLQQQFAKKLEGARFRTINEALYTSRGDEAFADFQANPAQFEIYHTGFREQAAGWPYNPLDGIINWIKKSHSNKVIADLGCGDARLAKSVPNTVHSFDLVSNDPIVTACDIAHLPLSNKSVDIVVFCLALMGVNMADFIKEAHRILKPNGIIRIVEVRSRFDDGNNSIKKFSKFLKKAGFDITPHDSMELNKMFFELECVKTTRPCEIDPTFAVKACVYKKR